MRKLARNKFRIQSNGLAGLWLVVFFAFASAAFSATFTASLDRNSIVLGEQVTLTLKFEDGAPQAISNLPQVDGLRIASSVQQNSSSVFSGGVQTTVYSYSVVMEPVRTGEFVIPPFRAKVNGQELASQPLHLKVSASDAAAPPASFADKIAFLWAKLPKTNLFINEPIVLDLRIYLRSDVRRYDNPQGILPSGNGLTFSKFIQGPQYIGHVGNATFTVVPLSMAVTPVKTGTVALDPINGNMVVNDRDPMDIGGFFGPPTTPQQVALTSPRVDLQVLPLPTQGVPQNFNGAVGSYEMNVSAGPTNVVAGDPITLRIQISGNGALDTLTLPDQAGWDNFKAYPPTAKVNATDQLGIQGSKTFEEIVTPQNSDLRALPPVTFSFFDPEQKKYRTLTHAAIPLLVRAATPGAMPALAATTHSDNAAPTSDVIPIKQHLGTLAQITPPLIQRPWFLAMQGVPALALLSVIVKRKREESLANNPRLRRQRQVAQIVRDGLAELSSLAAQNKSDEFFATLFRLLQEQLGERLDLPASAITEAVIDERLRPAGASEAILTSLHELFQTCNLARYAPIESSAELAGIIPKLETTLNELRELKV